MRPVVEHYSIPDLRTRLRAALVAAGTDPDAASVADLQVFDQLHTGSFVATEFQVREAGLPAGAVALDAGCGIGGLSRYLADTLDCTVQSIDLTPEYVDAAAWLNRVVGFQDRITTKVASVLDLPFEDATFDAVLAQNVTMNIQDKPRMFREAFRVLKPGGIFTLTHIAEGPAGDPIFPLPWARMPDACFLGTRDEVLSALGAAGFEGVTDRIAEAQQFAASKGEELPIEFAPTMGDDIPERLANSARSKEEGRLVDMMILATRP